MKLIKRILVIIGLGAYLSICFSPSLVFAQTQGSTDQLQQQLLDIQNQIAQYQEQLKGITAQKNTLANKIKSLKKQQAVLDLQVKATNLQIADLGSQISDTQDAIAQNESKIFRLKNNLAGLFRQMNENDQTPFLYVAISGKKLSDVFSSYQAYASVSQNLSSLASQLEQSNNQLSATKDKLFQQQDEAQNLLSIKVLQQTQLQGSVNDQNNLLIQTKGRESDYQITINDSKKRAADILGQIYQLLGVSGQINFGQALKIAQVMGASTGIRPAFLLAVITQESNLGKNVGTCNRPTDPPSKSYKVVMKPDRDIQPFLQITQSLGIDPNITPVSCAMTDKSGNQIGWGGAMGPAQFIPSTWMGYKDKVSAMTGSNPANPWDIRDAFAAAAIKLVAGGADGSRQGEWNAAMRYFSGSTNVKYRFYGDSVQALADKYQSDIDQLK